MTTASFWPALAAPSGAPYGPWHHGNVSAWEEGLGRQYACQGSRKLSGSSGLLPHPANVDLCFDPVATWSMAHQSVPDVYTRLCRRLRNHACVALWCGGNEQRPAPDLDAALRGMLPTHPTTALPAPGRATMSAGEHGTALIMPNRLKRHSHPARCGEAVAEPHRWGTADISCSPAAGSAMAEACACTVTTQ